MKPWAKLSVILGVFGIGYLSGRLSHDSVPSPVSAENKGAPVSQSSSGPGHDDPGNPDRTPPVPAKSKQFVFADRYSRMYELLAYEGFTPRAITFDKSFEPGKQMGEFFGLSEDGKTKLADIGKKAVGDIKKWEKDNAKLLQSSDNELVYEIPANPQFAANAKGEVMETLQGLLGDDGVKLVSGRVNQNYAELDRRRVIQCNIVDRGYGVLDYRFKVSTFGPNGEEAGTESFNDIVEVGRDNFTAPGRFDHLFKFENN